MLSKKTFKVISPIATRDGGQYWLRCGTAYVNKDNSINVYVDALPVGQKEGLKLQLRELTDEELRERADKKASYQARGANATGGFANVGLGGPPPGTPNIGAGHAGGSFASDNVPF